MSDTAPGTDTPATPATPDTTTPASGAPGAPGPGPGAAAVPPGDADPAPLAPIRPAGLDKVVAITGVGSLAWLVWVWLATFVIVTGLVIGIGIYGELESSVWQGAAAGWQRWVVLAAGVTLISTFAPMLLSNGVTRDRLAQAGIATGLGLAVLAALFAVLGFLVEGVVFAQNDVAHRWDAFGNRTGRAIDVTMLPTAFVEYAIGVYAAYVTGWQVAIGFFRSDVLTGILKIPVAILPLIAVELLVGESPAAFLDNTWFTGRDVPFALTVVGSALVLGVTTLVARRRTAEIALRSA